MVEDRLVISFGEAILDHRGPDPQNHERDQGEGIVEKWRSPVKVSVTEGATSENLVLTREKLAEIEALSGLEFELTESADKSAPLTIAFSDKTEFTTRRDRTSTCYAHTDHDADGWITKAEINISLVEKGKWRTDCLIHELLHGVGWSGHTHSIRSAISYMHGEVELTPWDKYMLRALYDPRLKAGMLEEDAMATVRIIFREYLAED